MYEGDSFYTLSGIGQAGLTVLSLALALILFWTGGKIMKYIPIPLGIALGFGIFAGFTWLSPQIYYTYYMTVFSGLPWQVVIKDPPALQTLWDLLSFQGPATLSAHSLGLMGWALIMLPFMKRRQAALAAAQDDPA